jgi:hypothetical protein
MLDFDSNVFVSFLISIVFFILKAIMSRKDVQDDDSKKQNRKQLVVDSGLVFVLAYLVLSFRHMILPSSKPKIEVFTNEPNF